MTTVVLSPHTDDAIFSLGAYLSTLDDVIIATVFAGIPEDGAGHAKHTTLRAEHTRACQIIGATEINSTMLDDVYPPSPPQTVRDFIAAATRAADVVYIPIGIRHPDHVTVATAALQVLNTTATVRFYEELPYRTDYPQIAAQRLADLTQLRTVPALGDHYTKLKAVRAYASQIDDSVINRVMVDEHIWELVR